MKPGDKAMLVTNGRYGLHIKPVTIRSVTKTGLTQIEESDQRYRANGNPTGEHGRFTLPPRLQAWDDALWHKFQIQQAQRDMAHKLHRLAEKLQAAARKPEEAEDIWEALPYDVRKMIEV